MKKKKKRSLLLLAAGMASLALSLTLLLTTDSIFLALFFYLSFVLNIIGMYILLWGRNGGKEDGSK